MMIKKNQRKVLALICEYMYIHLFSILHVTLIVEFEHGLEILNSLWIVKNGFYDQTSRFSFVPLHYVGNIFKIFIIHRYIVSTS